MRLVSFNYLFYRLLLHFDHLGKFICSFIIISLEFFSFFKTKSFQNIISFPTLKPFKSLFLCKILIHTKSFQFQPNNNNLRQLIALPKEYIISTFPECTFLHKVLLLTSTVPPHPCPPGSIRYSN